MKRVLCALLSLAISGNLYATTWLPAERIDPLTGEKVACLEPASWGSYIYQWSSKYDLVFFPLTAPAWICFNSKNGYAAFNNDFEKMTDGEKKDLSAWLKKNYDPSKPPKTHEEKLAWLEKIYAQRTMNDDFWSGFYRLMAYIHRKDEQLRISYVKKALPLFKKKLETNPTGSERIGVLYLLGEYHRRLAQTDETKTYFAQVKTAKYIDEEGKEQIGHPYFLELVKQREKLKIGEYSIDEEPEDAKPKDPIRSRAKG